MLAQALPFPPLSLTLHLARLHALGLIEHGPEGWRVTLAGYPAVRRALAQAGFWTDELGMG